MSQQDDNNVPAETKVKRVVVWENEWAFFRHFARSLLQVRDWTMGTTREAREITVSAAQQTTETAKSALNGTINTSKNIYKDHPFYVLSFISLASMAATKRYTQSSMYSLFRNGVIGYGAGAAILYPKCFAAAVSQPREFLQETLLVNLPDLSSNNTSTQVEATTTATTTTTTSDATHTLTVDDNKEQQQ